MNKDYVAKWYKRQKNRGIIYKLTIGDHIYVGSTTNSLKKRLWQHRAKGSKIRKLGYDPSNASIELLEKVSKSSQLKEREQYWIDTLQPHINTIAAVKKPKPLYSVKGGVVVRGVWYPTRKAAWDSVGNRKELRFSTFRGRLARTGDIEYALGLKQLSID